MDIVLWKAKISNCCQCSSSSVEGLEKYSIMALKRRDVYGYRSNVCRHESTTSAQRCQSRSQESSTGCRRKPKRSIDQHAATKCAGSTSNTRTTYRCRSLTKKRAGTKPSLMKYKRVEISKK